MNINEHDDLGLTRLHKACQEGDVQEVVDLLRNGADVNVKSIRGTRQRGIKHIINSTPLHIATFQGDMEIVRLLLENGARIDAIDDVRYVLLRVVVGGHTFRLIFLTSFRNTSLHLAVWRKRLELCELLLWRGANANIANTSECVLSRFFSFVGSFF
jgi:ankyrin repeat protein